MTVQMLPLAQEIPKPLILPKAEERRWDI